MQNAKDDMLPKFIPIYKQALSHCDFMHLQEIRLRAGRPMMLYKTDGKKVYCGKTGEVAKAEDAIFVTPKELESQLAAFCRGSAYAYREDLGNGFITICGGHRVGVAGKAICQAGNGREVLSIKDVSGLGIRIAREFPGCADCVLPYVVSGNRIYSTLIIAPPGVGKTTVLRDLIRSLSAQFRVSVVDERSELAAMCRGEPSFDIGEQTDVLDAYPKEVGLLCALRALSPDVIVTDEIGTEADKIAICEILKGGCKIITSMHGYHMGTNNRHAELFSLFERILWIARDKQKVEVVRCQEL